MSKEKLLDQLEALKVAWASEFTDSIEFFEDEVERWLSDTLIRMMILRTFAPIKY
jgi:hypothetical protein